MEILGRVNYHQVLFMCVVIGREFMIFSPVDGVLVCIRLVNVWLPDVDRRVLVRHVHCLWICGLRQR